MKIAIIGTGISGLTAAFCLHNKHDVTIFEKNSRIGGHTHTIPVNIDSVNTEWIDTGFIVCNPVNYPNFFALMKYLDVSLQPTSMSFSVFDPKINFEYNPTNLNKTFSQRSNLFNLKFLKMLKDIVRFNKLAKLSLINNDDSIKTLSEFLVQHNFDDYIYKYFLHPMFASIWSAQMDIVQQTPVKFLFQFLNNHGMLSINQRPPWYSVAGGSNNYIKPMTKEFKNKFILNFEVKEVIHHPNHVKVLTNNSEHNFDKVIIATHSDEALNLLPNIPNRIRAALATFPYQANHVTVHQDSMRMPRNQRTWASWNFCIESNSKQPLVTYYMNLLQCLTTKQKYFVSLNQANDIDSNKIIKELTYYHPVFTKDTINIQQQHAQINIDEKIFFCGAYWGFGFHEDGLNSALRVVDKIDKDIICKMPFTMVK